MFSAAFVSTPNRAAQGTSDSQDIGAAFDKVFVRRCFSWSARRGRHVEADSDRVPGLTSGGRVFFWCIFACRPKNEAACVLASALNKCPTSHLCRHALSGPELGPPQTFLHVSTAAHLVGAPLAPCPSPTNDLEHDLTFRFRPARRFAPFVPRQAILLLLTVQNKLRLARDQNFSSDEPFTVSVLGF